MAPGHTMRRRGTGILASGSLPAHSTPPLQHTAGPEGTLTSLCYVLFLTCCHGRHKYSLGNMYNSLLRDQPHPLSAISNLLSPTGSVPGLCSSLYINQDHLVICPLLPPKHKAGPGEGRVESYLLQKADPPSCERLALRIPEL